MQAIYGGQITAKPRPTAVDLAAPCKRSRWIQFIEKHNTKDRLLFLPWFAGDRPLRRPPSVESAGHEGGRTDGGQRLGSFNWRSARLCKNLKKDLYQTSLWNSFDFKDASQPNNHGFRNDRRTAETFGYLPDSIPTVTLLNVHAL